MMTSSPEKKASRRRQMDTRKVLLMACPEGKKSITLVAKCLGVTRQAVYKWIKQGILPPTAVMPLVTASGGKLKKDDLLPYLV